MGTPIHVAGALIDPHGWDASDPVALGGFERMAKSSLAHAVVSQRNDDLVSKLTPTR
jgi:hypothetical protein